MWGESNVGRGEQRLMLRSTSNGWRFGWWTACGFRVPKVVPSSVLGRWQPIRDMT